MKWSFWHSVSPLRFRVDIYKKKRCVAAEQGFIDLGGEVAARNTDIKPVLLKFKNFLSLVQGHAGPFQAAATLSNLINAPKDIFMGKICLVIRDLVLEWRNSSRRGRLWEAFGEILMRSCCLCAFDSTTMNCFDHLLVSGCGIDHRPLLHVSRWDMDQTKKSK